METPILPNGLAGMPGLNVTSFHVSPPSVVFHSPLRPPPEFIPHGVRWNFHIDANRMRGFVGSIVRSIAPVESLRNSTFLHVLPPSVVRNTPRSAFGPKAWPIAATYTLWGSRGALPASPICRVSLSPSCCHVPPPSVERYTPVP